MAAVKVSAKGLGIIVVKTIGIIVVLSLMKVLPSLLLASQIVTPYEDYYSSLLYSSTLATCMAAAMEAVIIVIVVYVSYEDGFDDLTLESRKELLKGENGTIYKLFVLMNIIIIGSSCCLFAASKGAAGPIVAGVYQIVYSLVVLNCALKFVLFSFGLRRGGEIEGLSAI